MVTCFDWFHTRLEPIRERLIGMGYDVTILMSDYDHMNKRPRQERYEECTFIHVPPYRSNLSVQRIRSHFSFGRSVGGYIRELHPDLIYLQLPPNNTARFCTEYKTRHPETKLFVDIVDLWPESMPLGFVQNTRIARRWAAWRDDCIKAADHVFVECGYYLDRLSSVDRNKASILYLFKDQTAEEKQLAEACIRERKIENNRIVFAYVGSMNNILDIDGICRVLRSVTEAGYETELRAVGHGEHAEDFKKALQETGCKVQFYGAVYDECEKIRLLASCHYAFNMMKDTSAVGLTLKSIDYFSYGLPLINNIRGDTWNLVEKEKIGINETGEPISPDLLRDHLALYTENTAACFQRYFTKEQFVQAAEDGMNCQGE